jgi:hypothetical protein
MKDLTEKLMEFMVGKPLDFLNKFGKKESYEEFYGKVIKKYTNCAYEIEVNGKKMVLELQDHHRDLEIHEGTNIIVYGKRKFYEKQEIQEYIKDAFYIKILDSDGKRVLAEVNIPYHLL